MDGNDSDLYGGDGPALAQKPSPDAKEGKPDQSEGQSYLVNIDVCPGMKVGDKLTGRIVAVHEKEYECEYEKEGEAESGEQEGMAASAPAGAAGGGEADSMYG